jgi:membrane fusion protein (multidrug efflux system)
MLIKGGEAAQAAGPPPEVVSTVSAQVASWDGEISSVGSVEAGKGVTLSNESPGVISALRFESGDEVKQGAVLVELDSRVERAQLASAKARAALAKTTLERVRALAKGGAIAQEELDQADSAVATASADADALAAQIARKTVRAPFAGRLGIRLVNLGQYLNPGTPLTTLQSATEDYVDFSVPQQRLAEIQVGLPVKFSISGQKDSVINGTVAAIEPEINAATRTGTIRATVTDKPGALAPGMFVTAKVTLPQKRRVVLVPTPAVIHAAYGNSVFIVEEPKPGEPPIQTARQQFVRTGETRGDFVVVEEGLSGTETVVSAGAFKLRNGARITVNNDVQLGAKLTPDPEDH